MYDISTITALREVVLDPLAGPYALGYVIVGLGLATASGLLFLLGAAMVLAPIVVALLL